MNIVIPIGGKGERFTAANYINKKPLIPIFGHPMINYVINNLKLNPDDKVYVIYYDLDITSLQSQYKHVHFIKINKQTSGASETIMLGLPRYLSGPAIIMDCDTFYTEDVLQLYRDNGQKNAVYYVSNYETDPKYSYIKMNSDNNIIEIIEKEKISDNANTGIYCFSDINQLLIYSERVVHERVQFKNECYISCIIDTMLKDGHLFTAIPLNEKYVFSLGTPNQLQSYIDQTFIFLFDLDGTLIITDDIYFDVWKQILNDYNIVLTFEMFKSHIQGNSDKVVLSTFLPNTTIHLSERKDELFIKNIEKLKIVDGSIDFLKQIRKLGHRLAIVTNCNRTVAEYVINYIGIDVDFTIVASECNKPKPYPDPYFCAISRYGDDIKAKEKVIIFEDSKTGLISAAGTNPRCLVGVESIYSDIELLKYGVSISLKDFTKINIHSLLSTISLNKYTAIKNQIKNTVLKINVNDIELDSTKLKGGFISDVISLKIKQTTHDNNPLYCVLKLENKSDTFLSNMATDLCLYEREYYFYESIRHYVPIKTPEFYGFIKNDYGEKTGILMQNLENAGYKLNVDLNESNIDVSLKVIDSLAKLHSTFWNKDLVNTFSCLKKHNDPMFNPKWANFINSKWDNFREKWSSILSPNYQSIQQNMSMGNHLTLCHGDVKSPNIFFGGGEPYFIDWQYVSIGKGVQDLVFFMIESFNVSRINEWRRLFTEYYYVKLVEYGVTNYSEEEYLADLRNATCYFPFFVAIWFGTLNTDELLDKNFPFFFIQRLFNFMRVYYQ